MYSADRSFGAIWWQIYAGTRRHHRGFPPHLLPGVNYRGAPPAENPRGSKTVVRGDSYW